MKNVDESSLKRGEERFACLLFSLIRTKSIQKLQLRKEKNTPQKGSPDAPSTPNLIQSVNRDHMTSLDLENRSTDSLEDIRSSNSSMEDARSYQTSLSEPGPQTIPITPPAPLNELFFDGENSPFTSLFRRSQEVCKM